MGFLNRIGGFFTNLWDGAKRTVNRIAPVVKDVVNKSGEGLNKFVSWGRDARNFIRKIPVVSDIVDNTVGPMADKVLNFADSGGNLLRNLGKGDIKQAGQEGLALADSVMPVSKKARSIVEALANETGNLLNQKKS